MGYYIILNCLLISLYGISISKAEVCHIVDPITRMECSRVSILHGTNTEIHQSVLKQLCEAGHRHVLLKGTKPSQFQRHSVGFTRRAEQFAVFNIHRDDFSDKVNFRSGEAPDIMCNDDWFVDEEVKMTNGYNWYSNGLPLWPLLNQTFIKKKKGIFSRSKPIDWPNYGIGTPFYLVPSEIYNSRDPGLAIQKRFANDFAPKTLPQTEFPNAPNFKDKVISWYQELFLDQAGYARKDINDDFDAYKNWMQPLVKASLQPMIESYLRTQGTPKSGQAPICPDELYFYFHKVPCSSSAGCLLLNEFQLLLKLVNCPDTKIVVGYGMQGDLVKEDIVPVRTIGKSQSKPPSSFGIEDEIIPVKSVRKTESKPQSQVDKEKMNSAPCSKYAFQLIWYIFWLFGVKVSLSQLFFP